MKENDVLVSAIITTYKRPVEILQRAVESVLNQTHHNLQIIIVNDDPDDVETVSEIGTMLKSCHDSRINYIVHEKNSGACCARNTGIKNSCGDYIAFLDDDDEWLEEKTEKQLEGFKDETIGLVYSPYYNLVDASHEEETVLKGRCGDVLKDLLWTNFIGGCSMPMMRRSVFSECGMFDENLLSSQDYDMWLRICMKYRVYCVNEPLIRRYMQPESITYNFEKQKQGLYTFIEKYDYLYQDNKRAFNYLLERKVNKWIEHGHIREAFKLYRKALNVRPLSVYNILEPAKGVLKYFGICRSGI